MGLYRRGPTVHTVVYAVQIFYFSGPKLRRSRLFKEIEKNRQLGATNCFTIRGKPSEHILHERATPSTNKIRGKSEIEILIG